MTGLVILNVRHKLDFCFSHTVNLLINMPRDCYEELLAPLQEGDVADIENKDIEYDGKNMEAIVILLNFLYKRFDRVSIQLHCHS